MGVAVTTAEVYGIDRFAVNVPLDEAILASYLHVDRESSHAVKAATEQNADEKLHTVKYQLQDAFTYNQTICHCLSDSQSCYRPCKAYFLVNSKIGVFFST